MPIFVIGDNSPITYQLLIRLRNQRPKRSKIIVATERPNAFRRVERSIEASFNAMDATMKRALAQHQPTRIPPPP